MQKRKYRMGLLAMLLTGVLSTLLVMLPFCGDTDPMKSTDYIMPDSVWFQTRQFSTALKVEGRTLSDVTLNGEEGEASLYSLVKETMLVFRYFDRNCEPCIRKEAELMRHCLPGIGERLLLIGSFEDFRSMRAYNTANKIEGNAFQISLSKKLDWNPDEYESPYYFLLHPGGKTSHFFMAVPEQAAYIRMYLEGVNRLLGGS